MTSVLERNAEINLKIVKAYEKLERELKQLGVEIKPSYKLEHPLGLRHGSSGGAIDLNQ